MFRGRRTETLTKALLALATALPVSCANDRRCPPLQGDAAPRTPRQPWDLQKALAWTREWHPSWEPAYTHPAGAEIINAMLSDWAARFRKHRESPWSGPEMGKIPPANMRRIHVIWKQFPVGFVPSVKGASFVLTEDLPGKSDRPLYGTRPGDIGIRFDWFEVVGPDRVDLRICLLRYEEGQTYPVDGGVMHVVGGLGYEYTVKKVSGRWVAECRCIST